MNGKSKCKILKQIRKEIAEANDIEYVTSECKFQGECTGTCPKCEAEVRYLEQELSKRVKAGKAVAVAGIAAALVVGAGGCAVAETQSKVTSQQTAPSTTETTDTIEWDGVMVLPGDVTEGETTEPATDEWVGAVEETLMGDVALPWEE